MPYGQFYALAIFIMDRLDTKGVGSSDGCSNLPMIFFTIIASVVTSY